ARGRYGSACAGVRGRCRRRRGHRRGAPSSGSWALHLLAPRGAEERDDQPDHDEVDAEVEEVYGRDLESAEGGELEGEGHRLEELGAVQPVEYADQRGEGDPGAEEEFGARGLASPEERGPAGEV